MSHQLLLPVPTFQLFALAGLEAAVIAKKVAFRSCYEKPVLLWISVVSGLVRLYFQTTTFLYTFLGEGSRTTLNDDYHRVLAYLLIGSVSLEVATILAYSVKELLEVMRAGSANQVQSSKGSEAKK